MKIEFFDYNQKIWGNDIDAQIVKDFNLKDIPLALAFVHYEGTFGQLWIGDEDSLKNVYPSLITEEYVGEHKEIFLFRYGVKEPIKNWVIGSISFRGF